MRYTFCQLGNGKWSAFRADLNSTLAVGNIQFDTAEEAGQLAYELSSAFEQGRSAKAKELRIVLGVLSP